MHMYGVTVVKQTTKTPPKTLFPSEKIKKITYLILPFESATPSIPPLHSMTYKKGTGVLKDKEEELMIH